MAVDPQAQVLQLGLEDLRCRLAAEPGEDHAAHLEPKAPEGVDETEGVGSIGDAQVAPDFALFQVYGGHGHHDFHLVLQLAEHPDLGVGVEARQHPGGVIVVKEFSAKLQIEFAAELVNAGADVFRLHFQVFLVIEPKSFDHIGALPLISLYPPAGAGKTVWMGIMYQFLYEKSTS